MCDKDGPNCVWQSAWEATKSSANQTSCKFQLLITVTGHSSTSCFNVLRLMPPCFPIQK